MSYNVRHNKVKKCTLQIPMDEIRELVEAEKNIDFETNVYNESYLELCECSMEGHIDGDYFIVDDFNHYGEGSGYHWDDLLDLLKKSKGELEAIIYWEGDCEVYRLTSVDGEVKDEEIIL